MSKLRDLWLLMPTYFLKLLLWLQQILDFCLNILFGYKTKTGKETERKAAQHTYEKSAQIVSLIFK